MSEQSSRRTDIDAEKAVDLLSAVTGDHYRLVGPLAGGQTGATEIRRGDENRYVLKWELDPSNQRGRREGARLAERLRSEAHWPSPRQQLVEVEDCLLVVQEFMIGSNVDHITHDLVDSVIDLHKARLGLVEVDDPSAWAKDMLKLLIEGGNGYCLHRPLRTFDFRTRRVVERIEEIGRSAHVGDLDGNDIVHSDLHPGNLLQVDGRLTAVVDMDYTRLGDAAFDLAMLAVASLEVGADPGVRHRLFELGLHALSDTKRRVYVANLLLRNLDWSIRKNRTAETDFWLAESDRLLAVD